jgi:hypothetical protein
MIKRVEIGVAALVGAIASVYLYRCGERRRLGHLHVVIALGSLLLSVWMSSATRR